MIPSNTSCLKLTDTSFTSVMTIRGRPPHLKLLGIGGEILTIIGQHYGLCYEFVPPDQDDFGEGFSNGSGSGVVGFVARAQADVGGGMSITRDRYAVVDFSEHIFMDDFKVLYKRPVLGPEIAGFIRPFSPLMWILTFFTTVLIFVATWLVLWSREQLTSTEERLEKTLQAGGKRRLSALELPHTKRRLSAIELPHTNLMKWSADRALLTTISVLLSQDTGRPRTSSWSVRVVIGLWMLVSLILGTIYRSNLRAMLITPHLELPFDNIEQLIHSKIPLFNTPANYLSQIMQSAPKNSPLGRLYRQTFFHKNITRAVSEVYSGRSAGATTGLFAPVIEHYHFSQTGECGLYMMSEKITESLPYGYAFPKGSPLKPKFDVTIRALKEAGIVRRVIKQLAPNATHCFKPISSDTSGVLRSLSLGDFYGVFSIYAGGIVLASVTFAVEVVLGDQKLKMESGRFVPRLDEGQ